MRCAGFFITARIEAEIPGICGGGCESVSPVDWFSFGCMAEKKVIRPKTVFAMFKACAILNKVFDNPIDTGFKYAKV